MTTRYTKAIRLREKVKHFIPSADRIYAFMDGKGSNKLPIGDATLIRRKPFRTGDTLTILDEVYLHVAPKPRHILETMARENIHDQPAGIIAQRCWPKPQSAVWGARSGQWQSMGRILRQLNRLGLTTCHETPHGQKTWNLTMAGRWAAEQKPQPEKR